jgi:AraC-type DNA-binding domain-containing proteins
VVAETRKVIKPVLLKNTIEQKCVFIHCVQGNFFTGRNLVPMKKDSYYFVPAGQPVFFQHAKSATPVVFENEGFRSRAEREHFLLPIHNKKAGPKDDVFSIVGFDATVYNAISLFKLMGVAPFSLPPIHELRVLADLIIKELWHDDIGKVSMVSNLLKELVIHIIRYMYKQREYRAAFENLNVLLDERLVKIVTYIENNLQGDLSNPRLSEVAHISVDYVGQFFKNFMGIKLQDYIENKRLEQAYHLLRTTTDNIQGISLKVGFNDQAYFSRRFKLKYGVSAKEIRRLGHSLI